MGQYKFYKLNYFKGNIGSYLSQALKVFQGKVPVAPLWWQPQLIKQTAEYVLEELLDFIPPLTYTRI